MRILTRSLAVATLLFTAATSAFAEWKSVGPAVDYRLFKKGSLGAHVSRVDLTSDAVRVVVSTEEDRGLRVGEFAKRRNTIVAINADYFTEAMDPIGLTVGACGRWEKTKDTQREGVIAFGDARIEIYKPADVVEPPEPWIEQAVSGWPMIVRQCEALSAARLPGSDRFTRSPHPRTAVGLSEDETLMYLVVVEGRRPGVPGATLAELATFMREELDVCTAINLDGGGSSAMAVRGEIVNWTSDGSERRVVNHIGVVAAADFPRCEAQAVVGPSVEQK